MNGEGSDGLNAKIAIVTGAGSGVEGTGIGQAIAVLLARAGASVLVADRDMSRAERTRDQIIGDGGHAEALCVDVTLAEDRERLVAQAAGRLDILVNNAGTGSSTPLDDISEDDWDRVMGLNVRSAALLTKAAAPLLERDGGGAVVNIASIGGLVAFGSGVYGASKAALIMLGRDLAVAYGRRGIRVNTIAPGHLFTPFVGSLTPERRAARRDIAPLGIEGDAWDVARAAVFLASTSARFITGVCLPVDGGVSTVAPLTAHGLLQA
jgi:NAD(P)-dependent dehydrogenase (short-subunit alcohol dehydrogenase family)